MTRLNIDTGTEGNSATGDTLRTAMTKINANFLDLYTDLAATTSSGGILTNPTTNGNVLIHPNGTGQVEVDQLLITDDQITSLITNSDLTLSGNGTGGVTVQGELTTGQIVTNEITSNGSNANLRLKTAGTGDLIIDNDGQVGIGTVNSPDTKLHIKSASSIITLQRTADANKPGIDFQNSGGNVRAELRMDGTDGTSNTVFVRTYDGSSTAERFRVEHTGASVTGTLNIKDDSDSSGGDSTLIIRENKILAGRSNDKLEISASGSGEIEMGSDLRILGATPFLKIQRTDNANVPGIDFIGQADTSGAKILFDGTSGTANELIFQTFTVPAGLAEAFRVTGTGAKVSGILTIPDGSVTDNYAGFGDGDDLKIFHNGSHSIIRETGTGSLYIQSDTNVIIGKDSSSETMIKGVADGAVELYYDNSKTFETTSGGVSVTGNLAADGTQIDFTNLPTSDPGVAGRLFRSGNDVKISTG